MKFEQVLKDFSEEIEAMSSKSKEDNSKLVMSICKLTKIDKAEKASSESMDILLSLAAQELRMDSISKIKGYSNNLSDLIMRNFNNYEKAIDIILGNLE